MKVRIAINKSKENWEAVLIITINFSNEQSLIKVIHESLIL